MVLRVVIVSTVVIPEVMVTVTNLWNQWNINFFSLHSFYFLCPNCFLPLSASEKIKTTKAKLIKFHSKGYFLGPQQ